MNIEKIIYSVAVIVIIQCAVYLIKRYAKSTQERLKIRPSRYFAVKRLLSVTAMFLTMVLLLLVWNIDMKNAWASLAGVVSLFALAFFAVWSLIGNILAGVIIFFTSPFKIDDTIEVLPDGVKGSVLAVNTFYTVLVDEDNNYINIPNSLLFQKYIRVIKKSETS